MTVQMEGNAARNLLRAEPASFLQTFRWNYVNYLVPSTAVFAWGLFEIMAIAYF